MCLVLKSLLLGSCSGMMVVYMPTRGIPGLGSFMESIKTHTPARGEKINMFYKNKSHQITLQKDEKTETQAVAGYAAWEVERHEVRVGN